MVASSGDRLLDRDAELLYLSRLFPHALVVTPNLWEASLLVGRTLATVADMAAAAVELGRSGARHVLIKGGHLSGAAVDVLFDGKQVHQLGGPRIDTANVHGTGCTTAATIAARLAQGDDVITAVRTAKAYVASAIAGASPIGTSSLAVAFPDGPLPDGPLPGWRSAQAWRHGLGSSHSTVLAPLW